MPPPWTPRADESVWQGDDATHRTGGTPGGRPADVRAGRTTSPRRPRQDLRRMVLEAERERGLRYSSPAQTPPSVPLQPMHTNTDTAARQASKSGRYAARTPSTTAGTPRRAQSPMDVGPMRAYTPSMSSAWPLAGARVGLEQEALRARASPVLSAKSVAPVRNPAPFDVREPLPDGDARVSDREAEQRAAALEKDLAAFTTALDTAEAELTQCRGDLEAVQVRSREDEVTVRALEEALEEANDATRQWMAEARRVQQDAAAERQVALRKERSAAACASALGRRADADLLRRYFARLGRRVTKSNEEDTPHLQLLLAEAQFVAQQREQDALDAARRFEEMEAEAARLAAAMRAVQRRRPTKAAQEDLRARNDTALLGRAYRIWREAGHRGAVGALTSQLEELRALSIREASAFQRVIQQLEGNVAHLTAGVARGVRKIAEDAATQDEMSRQLVHMTTPGREGSVQSSRHDMTPMGDQLVRDAEAKEAVIKSLEQRVETLAVENAKLRDQAEHHVTLCATMDEEMTELRRLLAAQERALEDGKAEREGVNTLLRQREEQDAAKTREVEALRRTLMEKEIAFGQYENQQLKSDLDRAHTAQLLQELERASADVLRLQTALNEAQGAAAERDEVRTAHAALQGEHEALLGRVAEEGGAACAELKQVVGIVEGENSELREQLAAEREANSTLEEDVARERAAAERLEESLDEARARADDVQAASAQYQAMLEKVSDEHARVAAELAAADELSAELRKAVARLEAAEKAPPPSPRHADEKEADAVALLGVQLAAAVEARCSAEAQAQRDREEKVRAESRLAQRVAAADAALAEQAARYEAMQRDNDTMLDRVAKAEAAAGGEVQYLHDSAAAAALRLEEAEAKLAAERAARKELQAALQAASAAAEGSEKLVQLSREALEEEVARLRGHVTKVEEHRHALDGSLAEERRASALLKDERDRARLDNQAAAGELQRLQARLEDETTQLTLERKASSQLKDQSRRDSQTAMMELQALQDRLGGEMARLDEEVVLERKKSALLKAERDRTAAELQTQQARLKEETTRLDSELALERKTSMQLKGERDQSRRDREAAAVELQALQDRCKDEAVQRVSLSEDLALERRGSAMLRQELQSAEGAREELDTSLRGTEATAAGLHAVQSRLKDESARLEEDVAQLRTALNTAESRWRAADDELANLRQQLEAVRQEREMAVQDADGVAAELQASETRLIAETSRCATLNLSCADLHAEREALQSEMEGLKAQLQAADDERRALRQAARQGEEAHAKMQKDARHASSQGALLQEQVAALEEEVEQYRGAYDRAVRDAAEVTKAAAAEERKLRELLREQEATYRPLQRQLEEAERARDGAAAAAEEQKVLVDGLERAVDELSKANEQQRIDSEKAARQAADAAQRDAEAAECTTEALAAEERKVVAVRDTLAATQRQLDAARKDAAAAEAERDDLVQAAAQHKVEQDALHRQLAAEKATCEHVSGVLEREGAEHAEVRRQLLEERYAKEGAETALVEAQQAVADAERHAARAAERAAAESAKLQRQLAEEQAALQQQADAAAELEREVAALRKDVARERHAKDEALHEVGRAEGVAEDLSRQLAAARSAHDLIAKSVSGSEHGDAEPDPPLSSELLAARITADRLAKAVDKWKAEAEALERTAERLRDAAADAEAGRDAAEAETAAAKTQLAAERAERLHAVRDAERARVNAESRFEEDAAMLKVERAHLEAALEKAAGERDETKKHLLAERVARSQAQQAHDEQVGENEELRGQLALEQSERAQLQRLLQQNHDALAAAKKEMGGEIERLSQELGVRLAEVENLKKLVGVEGAERVHNAEVAAKQRDSIETLEQTLQQRARERDELADAVEEMRREAADTVQRLQKEKARREAAEYDADALKQQNYNLKRAKDEVEDELATVRRVAEVDVETATERLHGELRRREQAEADAARLEDQLRTARTKNTDLADELRRAHEATDHARDAVSQAEADAAVKDRVLEDLRDDLRVARAASRAPPTPPRRGPSTAILTDLYSRTSERLAQRHFTTWQLWAASRVRVPRGPSEDQMTDLYVRTCHRIARQAYEKLRRHALEQTLRRREAAAVREVEELQYRVTCLGAVTKVRPHPPKLAQEDLVYRSKQSLARRAYAALREWAYRRRQSQTEGGAALRAERAEAAVFELRAHANTAEERAAAAELDAKTLRDHLRVAEENVASLKAAAAGIQLQRLSPMRPPRRPQASAAVSRDLLFRTHRCLIAGAYRRWSVFAALGSRRRFRPSRAAVSDIMRRSNTQVAAAAYLRLRDYAVAQRAARHREAEAALREEAVQVLRESADATLRAHAAEERAAAHRDRDTTRALRYLFVTCMATLAGRYFVAWLRWLDRAERRRLRRRHAAHVAVGNRAALVRRCYGALARYVAERKAKCRRVACVYSLLSHTTCVMRRKGYDKWLQFVHTARAKRVPRPVRKDAAVGILAAQQNRQLLWRCYSVLLHRVRGAARTSLAEVQRELASEQGRALRLEMELDAVKKAAELLAPQEPASASEDIIRRLSDLQHVNAELRHEVVELRDQLTTEPPEEADLSMIQSEIGKLRGLLTEDPRAPPLPPPVDSSAADAAALREENDALRAALKEAYERAAEARALRPHGTPAAAELVPTVSFDEYDVAQHEIAALRKRLSDLESNTSQGVAPATTAEIPPAAPERQEPDNLRAELRDAQLENTELRERLEAAGKQALKIVHRTETGAATHGSLGSALSLPAAASVEILSPPMAVLVTPPSAAERQASRQANMRSVMSLHEQGHPAAEANALMRGLIQQAHDEAVELMHITVKRAHPLKLPETPSTRDASTVPSTQRFSVPSTHTQRQSVASYHHDHDLRGAVGENPDLMRELSQQVRDLEARLDESLATCAASAEVVKSLEEEGLALRGQLDEAERTARAEQRQRQAQVQKDAAVRRALEDEVEALQRQLEEAHEEGRAVRRKQSQSQRDVAGLRTLGDENESLRQQLDEALNRTKAAERKYGSQNLRDAAVSRAVEDEATTLRQQLDDAHARAKSVQEKHNVQLKRVQDENEALLRDADELRDEVHTQHRKLQQLEREQRTVSGLEADNEALRQEVEEAQKQLRGARQREHGLPRYDSVLRGENDTLKKQLDDARRIVKNVRHTSKEMGTPLTTPLFHDVHAQPRDDNSAALGALGHKLRRAEAEIEALRTQLKEATVDPTAGHAQLKDAEQQVVGLEGENEALRTQLREAQNHAQPSGVDELRLRIEGALSGAASGRQQNGCEEELRVAKESLARVEGENEALRVQLRGANEKAMAMLRSSQSPRRRLHSSSSLPPAHGELDDLRKENETLRMHLQEANDRATRLMHRTASQSVESRGMSSSSMDGTLRSRLQEVNDTVSAIQRLTDAGSIPATPKDTAFTPAEPLQSEREKTRSALAELVKMTDEGLAPTAPATPQGNDMMSVCDGSSLFRPVSRTRAATEEELKVLRARLEESEARVQRLERDLEAAQRRPGTPRNRVSGSPTDVENIPHVHSMYSVGSGRATPLDNSMRRLDNSMRRSVSGRSMRSGVSGISRHDEVLSSEIAELRQLVELKVRQAADFAKENDELRRRLDVHVTERAAWETASAQLRQHNETVAARSAQLQAQLKAAEDEVARVSCEAAQARAAQDDLEVKVAEVSGERDALTERAGELAGVNARNEELQVRLRTQGSLIREDEEKTARLNAMSVALADTRKQLAEVEAALREAKHASAETEETAAHAERLVEELQASRAEEKKEHAAKIRELEERLDGVRRQLDTHRRREDDHGEAKKEMAGRLGEVSSDLAKLQTEVVELRGENSALRKELMEAEENAARVLKALREEEHGREEERRGYKFDLQTLEDEISDLKKDLEDSEELVGTLRGERDALKDDNARMAPAVAALASEEKDAKKLRRKLDDAQRELARCERELRVVKERAEDAEAACEEAQTRTDGDAATIRALEEDLAAQQSAAQREEGARKKLRKSLDDAVRALEAERGQQGRVELDMDSLREEIEELAEERDSLRARLDDASAAKTTEADGLRLRLQQSEQAKKQLRVSLDEANRALSAAKSADAERNNELDEALLHKERLEERVENDLAKLSALEDAKREVGKKLDEERKRSSELSLAMAEARRDLQAATADSQRFEADSAALGISLAEMTGTLAQERRRADELAMAAQKARAERQAALEEHSQQRQYAADAAQDAVAAERLRCAEMVEAFEAEKGRCAGLSATLVECEAQRDHLMRQLELEGTRSLELSAALERADAKTVGLKESIASLREERCGVEEERDTARREAEKARRLKALLDESFAELAALKERISSYDVLEGENQRLQSELVGLQDEVATLRQQVPADGAVAKEVHEATVDEAQRLRKDLQERTEQLDGVRPCLAKMKEAHEVLSNELAQHRSRLEEAEVAKNHAEAQLVHKREENAKLETRVKSLEAAYDELRLLAAQRSPARERHPARLVNTTPPAGMQSAAQPRRPSAMTSPVRSCPAAVTSTSPATTRTPSGVRRRLDRVRSPPTPSEYSGAVHQSRSVSPSPRLDAGYESFSSIDVEEMSLGVDVSDGLRVGPHGVGVPYNGVRVVSVRPPAKPTLRVNDVIEGVNRTATPGLVEFRHALRHCRPGFPVRLKVRRMVDSVTKETEVTITPTDGRPGRVGGTNHVRLKDRTGLVAQGAVARERVGAGLTECSPRRQMYLHGARSVSPVRRAPGAPTADPLAIFTGEDPPQSCGRAEREPRPRSSSPAARMWPYRSGYHSPAQASVSPSLLHSPPPVGSDTSP